MSESRPDLRASDADREAVAARLRRAGEDGRLDPDELEERLGQAYAAKTFGQLDELTADLGPDRPARSGAVAAPGDAGPPARRDLWKLRWGSWAGTSVLLIGIWAITCIAAGELLFFWPIFPVGFWALGNVTAMMSGWGSGSASRSDDDSRS